MVQIYHFSNTMRRMNSRSPPFAIIGLVVVCLFISYNYWTLFSQNEDLKKDIEKLQAEIKIEGVKQDQFEKKNQVLQSNVHDLSDKSEKLQQKLGKEEEILKELEDNVQNKDLDIASLKTSLNKKNEIEKELNHQLDDRDGKIEELIRESQHILVLKNDADETLADKDSQINTLKMQLEQLKAEMNSLKTRAIGKQKLEMKPSDVVKGPFNIPNIDKKEQYLSHGSLSLIPESHVDSKLKAEEGFLVHAEAQMIPRQESNAPRAKPSVSVAHLEKMLLESLNQIQQPMNKLGKTPKGLHQLPKELHVEHKENSNIVLPGPPLDKNDIHDDPVDVVDHPHHLGDDKNGDLIMGGIDGHIENIGQAPNAGNVLHYHEPQNVLVEPPQKADDNPDVAIDEVEHGQDDPLDDQDEEGKEIKKEFNNDENYEYDTDPRRPPAFGDAINNGKHLPFGDDAIHGKHLSFGDPINGKHLPFGDDAINGKHLSFGDPINDKHLPFGDDAINGKHLPFGDAVNDHQGGELGQRDQRQLGLIDEENKANERVFEANFDKKIRNIGARHL